jgi:hypothetical protein
LKIKINVSELDEQKTELMGEAFYKIARELIDLAARNTDIVVNAARRIGNIPVGANATGSSVKFVETLSNLGGGRAAAERLTEAVEAAMKMAEDAGEPISFAFSLTGSARPNLIIAVNPDGIASIRRISQGRSASPSVAKAAEKTAASRYGYEAADEIIDVERRAINALPEILQSTAKLLLKYGIVGPLKIAMFPLVRGMKRLSIDDFKIVNRGDALDTVGGLRGSSVDGASGRVARLNAATPDPQKVVPATVDGKIITYAGGDSLQEIFVGVWSKNGDVVEFVKFDSPSSFVGNYYDNLIAKALPEYSATGVFNSIRRMAGASLDYYIKSPKSGWSAIFRVVSDLFLVRAEIVAGLRLGGPAIRYIAANIPVNIGGMRIPNFAKAVTDENLTRLSVALNYAALISALGKYSGAIEWFLDNDESLKPTQARKLAAEIKKEAYTSLPGINRKEKIDKLNDLLYRARGFLLANSKEDDPNLQKEELAKIAPAITDSNYKNVREIASRASDRLNEIADQGSALAKIRGFDKVLRGGSIYKKVAESMQDSVAVPMESTMDDGLPSAQELSSDAEDHDPERADDVFEKAKQISKKLRDINDRYTRDALGGPTKRGRIEVDTTDADDFVPTPKPDQPIPDTKLGIKGFSRALDEALSSNNIIFKPARPSARMKVKIKDLKNED